MKKTILGSRFRRGDKVYHRQRPDIPGMVRSQHKSHKEHQPIAQYMIEWERSPLGYGKTRITHEWEADLRVLHGTS